jgi:hypothetical protein
MASQVTSGFSTEATQYAYDNSYYLLDNVPGAGDVLEGPITVTGNLTTTGNEIVQGALGVVGVATAEAYSARPGKTTPLTVTGTAGSAGGLTLQAGGTGNIALQGAATIGATASGNVALTSLGGSVALQAGGGQALVQTLANGNVSISSLTGTTTSSSVVITNSNTVGSATLTLSGNGGATLATAGFDRNMFFTATGSMFFTTTGLWSVTPTASVTSPALSVTQQGQVSMGNGLTCHGSVTNPVLITGGFFQMTANKGFFYTVGDATVIVAFPRAFSTSGAPTNTAGYGIIKGIANNSYSPLVAYDNGAQFNLGFTPSSTNYFQILVL